MPMAVFTFLEHFDFTGKIIRPFCTHEGSGMADCLHDLINLCPDAKVEEGLVINGSRVYKSGKEIEDWVAAVGKIS